MNGKIFIDFGVTPYALADVCEALFKNGVTNGFITKEDGDIHIRWKYDINRGLPVCELTDTDGQCKAQED